MDTEIAAWETANPKLSLIQVLTKDTSQNQVYLLDVLEKPELINFLIEEVMREEKIEKIFHNASFDLKYLGKKTAKNITCTYQLARRISKQRLGTSNLKLKTLAVELCQFPKEEVDLQQQSSDWGKRPLDDRQLRYAEMDVVYLLHVHQYLLKFHQHSQENLKMNQAKIPTFTVTDVRIAFECPRLFYLSKHFGGKTLFIPADQPKGIGQPFHKLAFKFIELAKTDSQFKEIFKPNPKDLNQEQVTREMQRIFYERVVQFL
jgi:S-DNA-T family DNA segregation ATPase FtsK/SpoIIIE